MLKNAFRKLEYVIWGLLAILNYCVYSKEWLWEYLISIYIGSNIIFKISNRVQSLWKFCLLCIKQARSLFWVFFPITIISGTCILLHIYCSALPYHLLLHFLSFSLCIFVPTVLSIQWISARIQINYYEIQVTPQNNKSPHMPLKTVLRPFSLPQNEPQLSVLNSLVDYSWEHTDTLFSAYLVSLLMQSADALPSIIAYLHSSSGGNSVDWISLSLFPLWTRTYFSPSSSHFMGTLLIIS